MKGKLLLLWLVIFTSCVFAQTWVRHLEWEDLVPAGEQNPGANAYNVIPAVDGGYIMQGGLTTHQFLVDSYTNIFWKVSSEGEVIWRNDQYTYDHPPLTCLVSNGMDKYYGLSSEYSWNTLYTYDAQLNPINSIMIDTLLTNGEDIQLMTMISVNDGLVFGGRNRSNPLIMKLGFDFTPEWVHTINIPGFTILWELSKSPDNGFIGVGQKQLIRFNSNGDTLWVYEHLPTLYAGYTPMYNYDGTITLIGYMDNVSVVRFTDNGELLSANPLQLADVMYSMGTNIPMYDGSLLLFERRFTSYAPNATNIGVLHKISQLGEVIWSSQVLSSNNTNNAGHGQNPIFEDDDGYYVMAIDDFILVRSDHNGNAVSNNDPSTDTPGLISIRAYPNPAKERINFAFSNLPRSIKLSMNIYNLRGQLVDQIAIGETVRQQQWELPFGLGNGVYIFNILDCGNLLYSGKFTIVR